MSATQHPGAERDEKSDREWESHEDVSRETPIVPRGRVSLAERGILFYQEYISPMKAAPSCRFEPTCSAYALDAVREYGALRGLVLAAGRLARCGPWHPGGWDPVKPRRRGRGGGRSFRL